VTPANQEKFEPFPAIAFLISIVAADSQVQIVAPQYNLNAQTMKARSVPWHIA